MRNGTFCICRGYLLSNENLFSGLRIMHSLLAMKAQMMEGNGAKTAGFLHKLMFFTYDILFLLLLRAEK